MVLPWRAAACEISESDSSAHPDAVEPTGTGTPGGKAPFLTRQAPQLAGHAISAVAQRPCAAADAQVEKVRPTRSAARATSASCASLQFSSRTSENDMRNSGAARPGDDCDMDLTLVGETDRRGFPFADADERVDASS
eukprot:3619294-Prymnesium_polylepis.1